jgi:hypothetical protein
MLICIVAFKAGLNHAKVDWEMTVYSGTKHSFADRMAVY